MEVFSLKHLIYKYLIKIKRVGKSIKHFTFSYTLSSQKIVLEDSFKEGMHG